MSQASIYPKERIYCGVDKTTEPTAIYLSADGHHFYFADAREFARFIEQAVGCFKYVLPLPENVRLEK